MNPSRLSRRRFLSVAAGAGVVLSAGCSRPAEGLPSTASAVDSVPLGRSGASICRIGLGTGSDGGSVQRALGRQGLDRLVRYAYDRGITYIDTADAYQTHDLIRTAIQGLPRERLWIQTKIPWQDPAFVADPLPVIDRYRRELDTDYLDSLLIHCTTTSDWSEQLKPMMDGIEEAVRRGWIRLKRVSCHGLPALQTATHTDWVDVHLVRLNPLGRHCDGDRGDWGEPSRLEVVVEEVAAMRSRGRGIIGMKIIGNGEFTDPERRRESIRYAVQSRLVDSMVIGFKSEAEIDEALANIQEALQS